MERRTTTGIEVALSRERFVQSDFSSDRLPGNLGATDLQRMIGRRIMSVF
jgi:hypothetical protein